MRFENFSRAVILIVTVVAGTAPLPAEQPRRTNGKVRVPNSLQVKPVRCGPLRAEAAPLVKIAEKSERIRFVVFGDQGVGTDSSDDHQHAVSKLLEDYYRSKKELPIRLRKNDGAT